MFNDWNSTNPNSIGYYFLYISMLFFAYLCVMFITKLIKNKCNIQDENKGKKEEKEKKEDNYNNHFTVENLSPEQRSLRFRFLLVSTAIKAAVWVKAPYIFALYNRLHGFTRGDIGILYAIDNTSGLIMGPILGSFGDMYGRKKFCFLYCVIVATHIMFRLMGSQPLAYFAQFLTGVAGALIETVFESWLNFEASLLFEDNHLGHQAKNFFLRDIFSKQVNIDCYTSIILTAFASVLYLNYGLIYPFYACIFFITLAGVFILIFWKENDIDKLRQHLLKDIKHGHHLHAHTFCEKIKFSWQCIREDKALFSVGVIECCFKISLQLFIFIWTPLLEETAGGIIHPGSVFVCFMIARLMGSELFELFKMILQTNSYLITIFITSTACAAFFVDYAVVNFSVRFFMFVYFDGLAGIFNPLLSSLKSQMIPEKLRTTIMNFFRIPINVFSIITLILTNYVTTYQICLVAFFFMLIGTLVNAYLLGIHQPPDHKDKLLAIYHEEALYKLHNETHSKIDSVGINPIDDRQPEPAKFHKKFIIRELDHNSYS